MYSCPNCKSKMEMQKTFNQKIVFACSDCKLKDIVNYAKNTDESYLDFLNRFDSRKIPSKKKSSTMLEQEGIIQSEDEIKKMVGNAKLDEITHSILFSKKYYVSYFRTLSEPDPQMGNMVSESGLDDNIIHVLESKKIEKFYKFQEDAIRNIMMGNNVIISAPTASGKTESFVIPVLQKILEKGQNGIIQALFVYPTKSLSKDQLPKIKEIADEMGIRVEIFDGDTKELDRKKIVEDPPHVITTKLDVLNTHMWHR